MVLKKKQQELILGLFKSGTPIAICDVDMWANLRKEIELADIEVEEEGDGAKIPE